MTHVLPHLKAEIIVKERLVVVGIAQTPVRVGRHAEQGHVEVVAQLILNFDADGLLGKTGRSLTENLILGQSLELRRAGHRTAALRVVEHDKRSAGPRRPGRHVLWNCPALRGDDQHGQAGTEIGRGVIQENERPHPDDAGKQNRWLRRKDAHLDGHVGAEGDRRGVKRRVGGGQAVVQGVANGAGTGGVAERKCERTVGIDAGLEREARLAGEPGPARRILRTRRGGREIAHQIWIHAIASIRHIRLLGEIWIKNGGHIGLRIQQGQIAAGFAELEIGVQRRRNIRSILRGGPNDEILVGRQRHSGQAPFGQICSGIAQEPAVQIRVLRPRVEQFDPILPRAVVILDAVAVVGHELRNDDGRLCRHIGIQRVTPTPSGEGIRRGTGVGDARHRGERHLHHPGRRLSEIKCVVVRVVGDDRGRGDAVDQQICGVHPNHTLAESDVDERQTQHNRTLRRTGGGDDRRGEIHQPFHFKIELKIGTGCAHLLVLHREHIVPFNQR